MSGVMVPPVFLEARARLAAFDVADVTGTGGTGTRDGYGAGCGLFRFVYLFGLSASWGIIGLATFADGRMVGYPQAPTSEDIRSNRTVDQSDMIMDLHLQEHFVAMWRCNTPGEEDSQCLDTYDHTRRRFLHDLRKVQILAWGLGILCFGIAGKFGLKSTMLGSLVICAVGLCLWGLTQTLGLTGSAAYFWILACKGVICFGCGLVQFAGIYWPYEMFSPRNRAVLALVPHVTFCLGALSAGWLWSLVRSWTVMLCLTAAAPTILLSVFALVDSPTMYAEELRKAGGDPVGGLADTDDRREDGDANGDVADPDDPDVEFGPAYVKNLVILMLVWFVAGNSQWANESSFRSTSFGYNQFFISRTRALPGYLLGYLMNAFIPDRRLTLSLAALGAALMCVGESLAARNGDEEAVLRFEKCLAVFPAALSSIAFVVCPPVFNGRHRHLAMGILGASGQLGCWLGMYMGYFGLFESRFADFYYVGEQVHLRRQAVGLLVIAVPLALASVLVWLLPSGAGSWTWHKGVADSTKCASTCGSGMSKGQGGMRIHNWSYFFSSHRAITIAGLAVLYAAYLFGSGWALRDFLRHAGDFVSVPSP